LLALLGHTQTVKLYGSIRQSGCGPGSVGESLRQRPAIQLAGDFAKDTHHLSAIIRTCQNLPTEAPLRVREQRVKAVPIPGDRTPRSTQPYRGAFASRVTGRAVAGGSAFHVPLRLAGDDVGTAEERTMLLFGTIAASGAAACSTNAALA